jgi:hypothetical protein
MSCDCNSRGRKRLRSGSRAQSNIVRRSQRGDVAEPIVRGALAVDQTAKRKEGQRDETAIKLLVCIASLLRVRWPKLKDGEITTCEQLYLN